MPIPQNPDNEGVDFSNFFKNSDSRRSYMENPNPHRLGKKYAAIAFFIFSLAVSGFLVYKTINLGIPVANYEPPAGYQMVYPTNEPPKLEAINAEAN